VEFKRRGSINSISHLTDLLALFNDGIIIENEKTRNVIVRTFDVTVQIWNWTKST